MIQNLKKHIIIRTDSPVALLFFLCKMWQNPPWKLNWLKVAFLCTGKGALEAHHDGFNMFNLQILKRNIQSSVRAWKVGEHSGNSRRSCILFSPFPVCFESRIRGALTLWTCFLAPSCVHNKTQPNTPNHSSAPTGFDNPLRYLRWWSIEKYRISNTPNLRWFARIPHGSLHNHLPKGILTTKKSMAFCSQEPYSNTYCTPTIMVHSRLNPKPKTIGFLYKNWSFSVAHVIAAPSTGHRSTISGSYPWSQLPVNHQSCCDRWFQETSWTFM